MATNGNNHADLESGESLEKIRTAGSVSISPELFEKLYLQPRDAAASKGLRNFIGNPTPIGLCGFLLCLTPLSNALMGWHGAGNYNGGANMGAYWFFGGIMMNLGGLLELIVGNTFPAVVFLSFGCFWLEYGAVLQNSYFMIVKSPGGAGIFPTEVAFMNEFAFTLIWMGFLCFIYLIVSLRTNICFVIIFFTLVMTFAFLAGAFWQTVNENAALALRLQITGGAFGFITCVSGWYLLAVILLASVNFPIAFPVGDLSHIIKGKKEK